MTVASVACPIATMPDELLYKIFLDLDAGSLARSSAVSKHWNQTASDIRLWIPLWKRLDPNIKIPQKHVKGYADHKILLKSELLARVQQFANKLQFGQIGWFHCPFLKHPGSSIHISCISGNLPLTGDYPGDPRPTEEKIRLGPVDVDETWFFLDWIGFGPGPRMGDLKLTKFYYVDITAWLPAGQIDQRFVERLGKIVIDRLEYLRTRRDFLNVLRAAVPVAVAAFTLGYYLK